MEEMRSDFTATFRQLSEASAEQLHSRNFTQVRADLTPEGYLRCWRRFCFCDRCGLFKTCRPTSSSLIGWACTCCVSTGKTPVNVLIIRWIRRLGVCSCSGSSPTRIRIVGTGWKVSSWINSISCFLFNIHLHNSPVLWKYSCEPKIRAEELDGWICCTEGWEEWFLWGVCPYVCDCSLSAPGLTVFYFSSTRWRICTTFYLPRLLHKRPLRRQVMQPNLQPGRRV